jgi:8-oxo-dGTP diphosphatase
MVVAAGIITRKGRILICQRRKQGWGGLKWEFPGGKVENGEEPQECLRRELKEELAIEPEIGPLLCRVKHRYPDREVELVVFHIPRYTGRIHNRQFESNRWVGREDIARFDFLEADRPVIEALARERLFGDRQ